MEEPVHPLTDQTRFVRELLAVYKEYPVLWDRNHPHYRNRSERSEAVEVLLQKCREFHPDADEDFVKLKIDSLRACFRKEWNKVCISKASAERPEDIHKPSLWYYNLLLYTVGEECPEEEFTQAQDGQRVLFWSREYTMALINLLKKQPCLYDTTRPANLAKRNAALRRITQEINTLTGKSFTADDIRKKIQLLKGQYRYECRKIRKNRKSNSKKVYKPNLWCFDMLCFLKGHVHLYNNTNKSNLQNNSESSLRRSSRGKADPLLSPNSDNFQDVKEEIDTDDDAFDNHFDGNDSLNEMEIDNDGDYDDIYDTIGKNVARKLRDMTDDQRIHAERLINDVMYHGQMENLSGSSKFILNKP